MKKILFLILIIVISGCVSRKTAVKESVKLDAVEKVALQVKETTNHSSYSDVVKDVKTNVADKSVTRTTETKYSEPDADGKQHKTSEKTTETHNDVQTINEANERTISEQRNEIERLTVDNTELRTKLDAALSEKTKTTTRAPFWTYIVAAAIGAGGTLMLRTWLKTRFSR